jgi:glycosyltransferase involved in cell wall biosynthesis
VRIVNGIELAGRAPFPKGSGTPPHLVFAGRLNPQKCPVFLVELLATVKDLPWRLTLIGDGALMPGVREKIREHQLESRIALPGWLAGAAVQDILRDADMFVLPSSSEGLPVEAVEALRQGLAVIASDIPGVHDVVEPGVNGFRLPVGDVPAWSAALRRLLQAPAELVAMRQASWQKAAEFDLSRIATEYENVLRSAAAAASKP